MSWRVGTEVTSGGSTISVYTTHVRAVSAEGVPTSETITVPFAAAYRTSLASGESEALLVAWDGGALHAARIDRDGGLVAPPRRIGDAPPSMRELVTLPLRGDGARWVTLVADETSVLACELGPTLAARCELLAGVPAGSLLVSREPLEAGWIGYVQARSGGEVLTLREVRSTTPVSEPDAGTPSLDAGDALDAGVVSSDAGELGHDAALDAALDAAIVAPDAGRARADAGAADAASASADAGASPPARDGGCSCRAAGGSASPAIAWMLSALLATLAVRRGRVLAKRGR